METQVKRSLTTGQVIKNFKAKGINLPENEAEQYLDMLYFFSKQIVRIHNTRKTCNPIEFTSIEPKKVENVNYNLFAKNVLVKQQRD